jgi:hypothetical protein
VAGEAGVNFFSISASQFVEIYVGVGASRVRALYQEAKENVCFVCSCFFVFCFVGGGAIASIIPVSLGINYQVLTYFFNPHFLLLLSKREQHVSLMPLLSFFF